MKKLKNAIEILAQSLFCMSLFFTFSAEASDQTVVVERRSLLQGVYTDTRYGHDKYDKISPYGLCYADIEYPVISGMKDITLQKSLNTYFFDMAEKHRCTKDKKPSPEYEGAEFLFNEEILTFESFQTDKILSLKFSGTSNLAPASFQGFHTTEEGALTIDIIHELPLSFGDIINSEKSDALSQYVFKKLPKHITVNNSDNNETIPRVVGEHEGFGPECLPIGCYPYVDQNKVFLSFPQFGAFEIPNEYLENPELFAPISEQELKNKKD